jgi:hypothetical protein
MATHVSGLRLSGLGLLEKRKQAHFRPLFYHIPLRVTPGLGGENAVEQFPCGL